MAKPHGPADPKKFERNLERAVIFGTVAGIILTVWPVTIVFLAFALALAFVLYTYVPWGPSLLFPYLPLACLALYLLVVALFTILKNKY